MKFRRRFPCFVVLAFAAFAAGGTRAAAPATPEPRGGRVGWARLVTPSSNWSVHSDHDPEVASFIRTKTNLNMDPTCYPVDPSKLDDLGLYPLIFTNDLTPIHDRRQIENLSEYVKRGGFLYVDACANTTITGDVGTFYQRHVRIFATLFPGSTVKPLPRNHEIYKIYFPVNLDVLYGRGPRPASVPGEIYGVYDGDRVIGIISFSTVLCGWPQKPERIQDALKLIVNLYVYAMSR